MRTIIFTLSLVHLMLLNSCSEEIICNAFSQRIREELLNSVIIVEDTSKSILVGDVLSIDSTRVCKTSFSNGCGCNNWIQMRYGLSEELYFELGIGEKNDSLVDGLIFWRDIKKGTYCSVLFDWTTPSGDLVCDKALFPMVHYTIDSIGRPRFYVFQSQLKLDTSSK